MVGRWSTEQVLALAPDAASAAAARKLATPSPWLDTGATSELVFGLCSGSGKNPYQTAVDLDGPAYHCSCPSRKFPCKHALALLLNWASGTVADVAQAADFAREWKTGRSDRAERRAEREATGSVRDEAAALKRADQRAARVAAGLAELELWLCDQVRTGLAGTAGYRHVESVAARMVDAQAPGVASRLRSLGGIAGTGSDWPRRLLAGYAQLHLLARAHENLDTLPPDLAGTVRTHIGYSVAKEAVLAEPAVTDSWIVIGRRDVTAGAVASRRTWLRGQRTGRPALLLAFDPNGRFATEQDATWDCGTAIEADLHFYPGRVPLRALIGATHGEPGPGGAPDIDRVEALVRAWADELARDPWLERRSAILAGVPVPSRDGWLLAESATTAVPLSVGGIDPWLLLAVSGGRPVPVAGEWSGATLRPVAVWDGPTAVPL